MRLFFLLLFPVLSVTCFSQTNTRNLWYDRIFDSRYVQQASVFIMGVDSARHYYFNQFPGMDSLLYKAIAHADTAKYLRVYFSFVVNKYGLISGPHFIRIATTRYAKSYHAKTVIYFLEDVPYYEKAVKQMLRRMEGWKPAMQDGVTVNCSMQDYFQFWVGISPPVYH